MNRDVENLFHIYAIKNDTNNEFLYVGCTTQPIGTRLYQHCRRVSSAVHDAIESYGEENISIILLNDYYGNIEEAHFIEEEYTKMLNEDKKLFNKRFGDAHTEYTKAKLKKPRKRSHGVSVLMKYAGE